MGHRAHQEVRAQLDFLLFEVRQGAAKSAAVPSRHLFELTEEDPLQLLVGLGVHPAGETHETGSVHAVGTPAREGGDQERPEDLLEVGRPR